MIALCIQQIVELLISLVAYNRVFNVTNLLKNEEILIYSKRIDSTLRGNLGSETDAMLDALDDASIAMVVPCFPQAKRVLVGGYLLVNMVPLHKTEAALDPITPVQTSLAKEIFEKQSKYKIASLYLSDIMLGKKYLSEKNM